MSAASEQFALACLFCGGPHVTKTHVYARSYTQMFDDSDREYLVRHERTDPATGQTKLLKRAGTFAHKPLAHQLLTQIWPTRPAVRWPPHAVVAERDLEPLACVISANSAFRAA